MEVNDLIFKELMKRGYSKEGGVRVWNISDSKLWYLTPEQAEAYFKLADAGDYGEQVFDMEAELLKKNMAEITEEVLHGSAINLIDVGSGDGRKAAILLENLHKKVKLRYCPIDISSYMINKALERIRKLNKGEVIECKWNISDFDNLDNVVNVFRCNEFRQNFLLLLECTISNFDMHDMLYKLARAMDDGDYVLIGLPLKNKNGEELAKLYKRKEVDNFLGLVLQQMGFAKNEIEHGVRYKNSRIENYYTIKKDKKISFRDKEIKFLKGDQVLVSASYRFTQEELAQAMQLYFGEHKFFVSENNSWALILCRK